jgi:predicted metal-dependent hydrolase
MVRIALPDGGETEIAVRRSARARRILLQLDPTGGPPELVLPRRASLAEGITFAQERAAWLQRLLRRRPDRVLLDDGATVPLFGVPRRIVWQGEGRRRVAVEDGRLCVTGPREDVPVRVYTWLRRQAEPAIAPRARALSTRIGRDAGRITIRDTRSRWGSCSPSGRLSFSWRLVMAPETVLDYVVAHEVAHLVHLNHGPSFWRLVDELCDGCAPARDWLRTHGPGLHRYVHLRPVLP